MPAFPESGESNYSPTLSGGERNVQKRRFSEVFLTGAVLRVLE